MPSLFPVINVTSRKRVSSRMKMKRGRYSLKSALHRSGSPFVTKKVGFAEERSARAEHVPRIIQMSPKELQERRIGGSVKVSESPHESPCEYIGDYLVFSLKEARPIFECGDGYYRDLDPNFPVPIKQNILRGQVSKSGVADLDILRLQIKFNKTLSYEEAVAIIKKEKAEEPSDERRSSQEKKQTREEKKEELREQGIPIKSSSERKVAASDKYKSYREISDKSKKEIIKYCQGEFIAKNPYYKPLFVEPLVRAITDEIEKNDDEIVLYTLEALSINPTGRIKSEILGSVNAYLLGDSETGNENRKNIETIDNLYMVMYLAVITNKVLLTGITTQFGTYKKIKEYGKLTSTLADAYVNDCKKVSVSGKRDYQCNLQQWVRIYTLFPEAGLRKAAKVIVYDTVDIE